MAADGIQTIRTSRSATLKFAKRKLIRDLTRFTAQTTTTTEMLAMTPAMKMKEYMTLETMIMYCGGSGIRDPSEKFLVE
jgi:hypothetical protein